jgi:hypothetical protein
MSMSTRLIAVPVLALSLSACGAETASPASAPSATASGSTATDAPRASPNAVPPPAASSTPAEPAVDESFEIAFTDGAVTGDNGRLVVALGESVSITVTSTATDEVHLHGYDLSAPVSQGAPAVLTFDAAIPGVFEIELEGLGAQLASLQVQ